MTDTEAYATSVVQVLRSHGVSWLPAEMDAEIVSDLIEHHARYPLAPFEVIVDDPFSAKWRLHADDRDRSRVLLYIHRGRYSEADVELCRTVNDALRALGAGQ